MSEKKIIVIAIPDLKGNGAERVVLNLATGFNQANCDVHVIVFSKFIELPLIDNLKIHHFNRHYRWLPRSIRGQVLAPLLDRFIVKNCGRPNLVLSNLLPVDRIFAWSNLNVFFVIHNTMSFETRGYNRDKGELTSIYTKKPTICVSKGAMNDFKITFTTYALKPTCYIYNPVNTDQIELHSQSTSALNTANYIIHVGKFNDAKRHDVLIKAYHKSGVNNPLVLVGQGTRRETMKKLAKHLNIEDRVIFAGFHSNPYPLIKNARLMVLSSDFEGLSMAILEAITLGVPVVSTDCPSGPAEILPNKNLCSVGDIDALSELIKQAINKSEDYKQPLNKQFTLEFATKKYLSLIG